MKTTITIEQLAEKLNEKVWVKGSLKRIYLNNKGYNTKKMRTSTYIFKNEEDEFVVVCKIECPSQSWNWIKSQQDEVRENIYNRIREAIESTGVAGENESPEVPFSEDLEKMKEH